MLQELHIDLVTLPPQLQEFWESVGHIDDVFRGIALVLPHNEVEFLYNKIEFTRYTAFQEQFHFPPEHPFAQAALLSGCRSVLKKKLSGYSIRPTDLESIEYWKQLNNKVENAIAVFGKKHFGDEGIQVMDELTNVLYGDLMKKKETTLAKKSSKEMQTERKQKAKEFIEKYMSTLLQQ